MRHWLETLREPAESAPREGAAHIAPDARDDLRADPRAAEPRDRRVRLRVAWPSDTVAAGGVTAGGVAAGESPPPRTAERGTRHEFELVKLVQRVFLPVGASADASRSVLFTTPVPSRHAETTSTVTAEVLAAHTGRTVCLVDANGRDPFLHRRFGIENSRGLSDVLSGNRPASTVAVQLASRLWLVPAGPRLAHGTPSVEVLHRGMANLLATFDFVLLGACSLGVQPDAVQLALAVDGVVLVVDATSTRRDAARRAVETLQASHARVLGVIVRHKRPAAPDENPRR
jgi:protein-tyrosine kinase